MEQKKDQLPSDVKVTSRIGTRPNSLYVQVTNIKNDKKFLR